MNGYIGIYKGKQHEVYAESSYKAQEALAKRLKVKKSWQINIILCEVDGRQVTHSTSEI